MSTQVASGSGTSAQHQQVGIKETVTSLLIAFMLAFIFRGFIVEGFQIPTGSMAPTLLGKNVRFVSPHSGYEWTTGPHDRAGNRQLGAPLRVQGGKNQMRGNPPPPPPRAGGERPEVVVW